MPCSVSAWRRLIVEPQILDALTIEFQRIVNHSLIFRFSSACVEFFQSNEAVEVYDPHVWTPIVVDVDPLRKTAVILVMNTRRRRMLHVVEKSSTG